MAAFLHAVTARADLLELGCSIMENNTLVSLDENLKRSARISVNVSDPKYHELPPCLVIYVWMCHFKKILVFVYGLTSDIEVYLYMSKKELVRKYFKYTLKYFRFANLWM